MWLTPPSTDDFSLLGTSCTSNLATTPSNVMSMNNVKMLNVSNANTNKAKCQSWMPLFLFIA